MWELNELVLAKLGRTVLTRNEEWPKVLNETWSYSYLRSSQPLLVGPRQRGQQREHLWKFVIRLSRSHN